MPDFAPTTVHNTRHKPQFVPFPLGKVKFQNSFFPYFTQKYETLSNEIKKQPDTIQFKIALKTLLCPKRIKFLSRGSKLGNTLLTRIRVGRSHLNAHSFTVGLADTPACLCTAPSESTQHYMLDCPRYTEERRTLLDTFEQYIPKFKSFPKYKQLTTILHGIEPENKDIFSTNVSLQYATQNYILKTKRFDP